MTNPELELFFYRQGEAEYAVALTLRLPGDEAPREGAGTVRFADPALFDPVAAVADPEGYGRKLGEAVFAAPAVADKVREVLDAASQPDSGRARVRLRTDPRAHKLHRLRWELLRRPLPDPAGGPPRWEWLIAEGRVSFSRHLFSGDLRGVKLRPKSALRAAVVVCNPSDVTRFHTGGARPLAAIDVAAELQLARDGLRGLERTELTSAAGPVTKDLLVKVLHTEPDVLYLVAHGAVVEGEPRLLLQWGDDAVPPFTPGSARLVSAADLVDVLARGRTLPRLVMLVSCQSGGGGDDPTPDGPLTAIGPRLAEAGVASVMAMQGNLSMTTAKLFLPAFFAELQTSGAVDAAAAAGRKAAVDGNRPDAWVPLLFTRLVEGRIWYQAGTTRPEDFAWDALWTQINRGKCVPILGSGLLDPFVGDTRELARQLGTAGRYPLALSSRDDLPQVTQYLKVMEDEDVTRFKLVRTLAEAVRRRWPDAPHGLPADLSAVDGGAVQRAITAAWEVARAKGFEPHQYLAALGKFKLVVSTNPDALMATAFERAGRPAAVHSCDWLRDEQEDVSPPPPADRSTATDPTPARPHLFHLFGQLDQTDTLILTEDDYFRFLTTATYRQAEAKGAVRDADLFDAVRRGALASSSLLFLGFRIHDWDFRTLFRLLVNQPGRWKRNSLTHVAVQIDPEDGSEAEVAQARRYIQKLYAKLAGGWGPDDGKVAVFWGSPEEFLREMDRTCPKPP